MSEQDWTRLDTVAIGVVQANGGIAHVSAFDSAGLTRRQLAAVFRRGLLERPRIGWYVDPALPWQVKRAVRVGGIACCVSAALLWGLPVPPDAHLVLHVLVAEHEGRLRHNRDRARVLTSTADDREIEVHRRPQHEQSVEGRTSLVDTLLELAKCVPVDWWIAALDAALHAQRGGTPLLGSQEYLRLITLLPRRRRRLLSRVDPSMESCIETLLRLGMSRRRIGPVVPQAVLHPSCRVDFLIGLRLVVEVDGAAFHDVEQDRRRDELLAGLGYRVLRFSYDRIVGDIEAVLDEIEAALTEDAS